MIGLHVRVQAHQLTAFDQWRHHAVGHARHALAAGDHRLERLRDGGFEHLQQTLRLGVTVDLGARQLMQLRTARIAEQRDRLVGVRAMRRQYGRGDPVQLVMAQGLDLELALARVGRRLGVTVEQDEITTPGHQRHVVVIGAAIARVDTGEQRRLRAVQLADPAREEVARQGVQRSKGQWPVEHLDALFAIAGHAYQFHGIGQQRFARRSQAHRVAFAVDQGRAQVSFKQLNTPAQGRLR